MLDAVLFDFGGVFTASPFEAVRAAAAEVGVPMQQATDLCFGSYDRDTDHPWHRLERGEVSIAEARDAIVALAAAAGVTLDPFDVLARGGAGSEESRAAMVAGVRALRARGVRTALVTNNVREYRDGWRRLVPADELFELVVDSSEVGVRKPDPRIFRIALERMGGLPAQRVAFLDDAPGNVAAARALGLHAILVGADPVAALDELEPLLS